MCHTTVHALFDGTKLSLPSVYKILWDFSFGDKRCIIMITTGGQSHKEVDTITLHSLPKFMGTFTNHSDGSVIIWEPDTG